MQYFDQSIKLISYIDLQNQFRAIRKQIIHDNFSNPRGKLSIFIVAAFRFLVPKSIFPKVNNRIEKCFLIQSRVLEPLHSNVHGFFLCLAWNSCSLLHGLLKSPLNASTVASHFSGDGLLCPLLCRVTVHIQNISIISYGPDFMQAIYSFKGHLISE